MKKKLLFIFAVLTLRGLPQSGDIDTLYYARFIHLFPEYYLPNVHRSIYNLRRQSPVSSWQTLKVYDVLGNEVATLVNEYKTAGSYEIEFSLQKTMNNKQLTSGVFFYRLQACEFFQTKKMIFLQ